MDLLATSRKSTRLVSFIFILILVFLGFQSVSHLNQLKVLINQLTVTTSYNKICASSDQTKLLAIDVDRMTPEQVLNYFQFPNRASCQLVHDFGGKMSRKPSGLDGQKAVCLEPVELAPPVNNCLVYSFGINNEWSFDEAMADYGCEVYAFDPSMKMKNHDHTPAIHFLNMGLGSENVVTEEGWHILTLSNIYNMLKSRHGDVMIDYLKMDIEYDEWATIPQMIKSGMMDKVRQLAIEIHLHGFESLGPMRHRVKIIRLIEKSGMIRFDSKLNPWSKIPFESFKDGINRPVAYEIAWYNSKFLR